MDAIVKKIHRDITPGRPNATVERPSQTEVEAAVRTLIAWAGDDPTREGLLDTPERVVRAYEEWFASYNEEPIQLLEALFRGNCWLRRNRPSS